MTLYLEKTEVDIERGADCELSWVPCSLLTCCHSWMKSHHKQRVNLCCAQLFANHIGTIYIFEVGGVYQNYFSFSSLDDMPMGPAGRCASNEFLVCGGYVYMYLTTRISLFYFIFGR